MDFTTCAPPRESFNICRATRSSATHNTASHWQTALSSASVGSSVNREGQETAQSAIFAVPDSGRRSPIFQPHGVDMSPFGTTVAARDSCPQAGSEHDTGDMMEVSEPPSSVTSTRGMPGPAFAHQDVSGIMILSAPINSTGYSPQKMTGPHEPPAYANGTMTPMPFPSHGFNPLSRGAGQWRK